MKKLILSVLITAFLASAAYATDLATATSNLGTKMSNGVIGSYFVDGAPLVRNNFIISTANTKGNTAYGTGNFSTAIYKKACAGEACLAADLVTAPPSSWDATTAFGGWIGI